MLNTESVASVANPSKLYFTHELKQNLPIENFYRDRRNFDSINQPSEALKLFVYEENSTKNNIKNEHHQTYSPEHRDF